MKPSDMISETGVINKDTFIIIKNGSIVVGYGKIKTGQTFATINTIETYKNEKSLIKKLSDGGVTFNENDAFGYV